MGEMNFTAGQPAQEGVDNTISVNVKGRRAEAVFRELITSGSRGISAVFNFNADWNGLRKIVVFQAGDRKVDFELSGDSCEVPPEVMEIPRVYLQIGVYGVDGNGNIVIPTVYASVCRIEQGTEPDGAAPSERTKTLIERLLEAAENARNVAQSVREDADSGAFDGDAGADGNSIWRTAVEPVAQTILGVTRYYYSTSDLSGAAGRAVQPGDLIVKSGDRLYYVRLPFGECCEVSGIGSIKGDDGFAPGVTIEEITGGHRVTITSAAHPEGQSFDVLDGSGGGGPGATVFDCVIDGETMISTTGPDLEDVLAAAPNVIMRVSFDGETEQLYMLLAGNSGIFAAAGNGVILILSPVYTHGNDLTWVMEGIDIPFRTSQLLNDSGFLTQHQSLAAYRTAAAQDLIDQGLSQAIEGKYTKPPAGIPPEDLKETYLKEHQSLAAYRTAAAQDMIDAGKSDKVQEVTVATDGAVTQALDAGKVYHFTGALTALTLTLNAAAAGQQQYHLDFVSGATAPTVTIPATVTMPDGWTVEANTRYEIDILDGYGVAQSWEVTA